MSIKTAIECDDITKSDDPKHLMPNENSSNSCRNTNGRLQQQLVSPKC